jgi:hypothetical protein
MPLCDTLLWRPGGLRSTLQRMGYTHTQAGITENVKLHPPAGILCGMLARGGREPVTVSRSELHALVDRIPEADLLVTRKLLLALAIDWEVTPADSEGELTDQATVDIEAAEAYFNNGGKGIPHQDVLKEFGLA